MLLLPTIYHVKWMLLNSLFVDWRLKSCVLFSWFTINPAYCVFYYAIEEPFVNKYISYNFLYFYSISSERVDNQVTWKPRACISSLFFILIFFSLSFLLSHFQVSNIVKKLLLFYNSRLLKSEDTIHGNKSRWVQGKSCYWCVQVCKGEQDRGEKRQDTTSKSAWVSWKE